MMIEPCRGRPRDVPEALISCGGMWPADLSRLKTPRPSMSRRALLMGVVAVVGAFGAGTSLFYRERQKTLAMKHHDPSRLYAEAEKYLNNPTLYQKTLERDATIILRRLKNTPFVVFTKVWKCLRRVSFGIAGTGGRLIMKT